MKKTKTWEESMLGLFVAMAAAFGRNWKVRRLFDWTRPEIERVHRVKDKAWRDRRKSMRKKRMARKKRRGWA